MEVLLGLAVRVLLGLAIGVLLGVVGAEEVGALVVGALEVGALVVGASVGEKLEKQMMKPPSLTEPSVDHCSCVPAGVTLRFSMALNALVPVTVPEQYSLGSQSQSSLPGQMPGAYPEAESSDGIKIFIQSQLLSTS